MNSLISQTVANLRDLDALEDFNNLLQPIAEAIPQLRELAGPRVILWQDDWAADAEPVPPPAAGWVVHVSYCIDGAAEFPSGSYWYPSQERARAALVLVATQCGYYAPSASGLSVDLTPEGCYPSRAWVEVARSPYYVYRTGTHVSIAQYRTIDHRAFEERHSTAPYSKELTPWVPWQPLSAAGAPTTWAAFCRSVSHYGGRIFTDQQPGA